MAVDEGTFFEWYNNEATPEDKALLNRVDELGTLFDDMCFKPGTSSYELTKYEIKNNDGTWTEMSDDLPDSLENFDYCTFIYKAAEPEDCDGYFSGEDSILCVPPDANDLTVLHEMIHLHECVIDQLPMYWHDMLYWALYKDLRNKIPELDEIITRHAHMLNESDLYALGGNHDILFLLKSFDLDIRTGYPLGTVFAYGRANDFKQYSYIKGE